MDNGKLVETIRTLCKSNNITVTKLEETLGFSQGLISRWKDKVPSLDKIIDIADYFHVTLDEVVGRNQVIEDDFLNKLVQMTECKQLIWHSYSENEDSDVKQYFDPPIDARDFCGSEDFFDYMNSHLEMSYYTQFNNGYISIHANYLKYKIQEPYDLCIFLQADDEAELIPESYETKELLPLWLKILMALETNKPDELKVVDFKQQILSSNQSTKIKIGITGKTPQLDIEKLSQNELFEVKKLISTFSQPEMIKALQDASKLVQYLNGSTKAKTFNEILEENPNNKRVGD